MFKTKNHSKTKGRHLSPETEFKKGDIRVTGENNHSWKGDNASYSAIHMWIKSHYGKASSCSNDPTHKSKRYEWANISGKYKRDLSDYKSLCVSCHRQMDFTEETRKKMVNNQVGKKQSDETKRKRSIALTGNKNALGKKVSEDTKRRISLRLQEIRNIRGGILQIKEGLIIKVYKSQKAASDATGIKSNNINMVLNGSRKSAGGYNWKFEDLARKY